MLKLKGFKKMAEERKEGITEEEKLAKFISETLDAKKASRLASAC